MRHAISVALCLCITILYYVLLGRLGKEAKEGRVRAKERKKSNRGHEVENTDGLCELLKKD